MKYISNKKNDNTYPTDPNQLISISTQMFNNRFLYVLDSSGILNSYPLGSLVYSTPQANWIVHDRIK